MHPDCYFLFIGEKLCIGYEEVMIPFSKTTAKQLEPNRTCLGFVCFAIENLMSVGFVAIFPSNTY